VSWIRLWPLALLVGPTSAEAVETWREQARKVVEPLGVRHLRVENARGKIEVRPSADGKLHITAIKVVRAEDRATARELARATRVETVTRDGRYSVRVTYPRQTVRINVWESLKGASFPRIEVQFAIEAPARLPITLESTSGDLITHGLHGPQILRSTSGDLSIHDPGGPIETNCTSGDVFAENVTLGKIATVSGDVRVNGARGPLTISTTSGDVGVRRAEEALQVETVSGDVRVEGAAQGLELHTTSGEVDVTKAAGKIQVESQSGDVEVGFMSPLTRAEVSTASGDVVARLGSSLHCTLEMRTSSGAIETGTPVRTHTISRQLVRAVIGEGGAPVSIRSGSGNITVTGAGS
jgi:hypothetical protein